MICFDIRFIEGETIRMSDIEYRDDTILRNKFFIRQTDDSFYIKDRRIVWIAEDEHITASWRFKAIRELIDDQIIGVVESRIHGQAGDNERLGDECADDKDDNECSDGEFDQIPYEMLLFWLLCWWILWSVWIHIVKV